jgi:hypothetical protein
MFWHGRLAAGFGRWFQSGPFPVSEESDMASLRAELVAEVLWELKKVNKLATYTEIALRAGFKPGANGKTILNSLDAVKKDWPHLQWWRALPDDYCLDGGGEQANHLRINGYTLETHKAKKSGITIADLATSLYTWEEEAAEAVATA